MLMMITQQFQGQGSLIYSLFLYGYGHYSDRGQRSRTDLWINLDTVDLLTDGWVHIFVV